MSRYLLHERTMMRRAGDHALALSVCALALACGGPRRVPHASTTSLPPVGPNELRPPEAFDAIAEKDERSRALFLEATRVMLHPRCANCHPNGDTPAQGDHFTKHDPPVSRGDDHGVVGMKCSSCHQDHNLELARVPGAPKWALAPIEMAWIGRTPAEICEQLKDPKRNGGRTLKEVVEHSAHDELVAWGWAPGNERVPAPGTQKLFGALMAAWVDTGAACPTASPPPNPRKDSR